MIHIKKVDYSYLKKVNWYNQIQAVEVTLQSVVDTTKTTKQLRIPDDKSLYEVLVENNIIHDNEKYRTEIGIRISQSMNNLVEKRINSYETAIDIYTELNTKPIKDTRQYGSDENNGMIKHTEINTNLNWQPTGGTDEFPSIKFPCPYEYDKNYERVYIEGMTQGLNNLSLKLYPNYNDNDTETDLTIPNATLKFKLNAYGERREQEVDLLQSCTVTSKWNRKKGKSEKHMTFSSYKVGENRREVKLNTFMCYCRETERRNKEALIQMAKEETQYQQAKQDIKDLFGIEPTKQKVSSEEVTHKITGWSRYGTEAFVIDMKEGNKIFIDPSYARRTGEIRLMGFFDSTWKPRNNRDVFQNLFGSELTDVLIPQE